MKQLAANGDICDYWQRLERQSKTMCAQILAQHSMCCLFFPEFFSLVCETVHRIGKRRPACVGRNDWVRLFSAHPHVILLHGAKASMQYNISFYNFV